MLSTLAVLPRGVLGGAGCHHEALATQFRQPHVRLPYPPIHGFAGGLGLRTAPFH